MNNDLTPHKYDLTSSTYDFHPTLRRVCEKVRPKRVLEWGPGYSTKLVHEVCPKAEIISIEHQLAWYEKAKIEAPFAKLIHVPIQTLNTDQYSAYPMKYKLGTFDVIFVDGVSRSACLITASLILNPKGVILLHDSKTANYQPAVRVLQKLGFKFKRENRTGIFAR